MESVKIYQKLNGIKPTRFQLQKPFSRGSNKRFTFNLHDQELQYHRNFGVYITKEAIDELTTTKTKRGGYEGGSQKVSVIVF